MSSSAPPAVSAGPKLAWTAMAVCWLVVLFDGLDMFMYGNVLPHMLEEGVLGIDAESGGDLGSMATFGMLLGALCAGTVTDWVGRKKVILFCTVLFSAASGLCAAAPDLTVFGVGRFVAGVGLGGLLPTAITIVSEYAPRGRGNLFVALLMTAHQVGGILSALLALWIVEPFGWRAAFWVGVIPLVVAVPLILRYLPESLGFLKAKGRTQEARRLATLYDVRLPVTEDPAPVPAGRWDALLALFRNGGWQQTGLFWTASFGGLLLVYGVSTWLPTMMRGTGYELGSSLTFVVVINLGGIIGLLIAGRLSDRFGASRIAAIWFALTAAGVYLLGIPMPLALTYVVIFLTGVWLFSAQTMVYAAVAGRTATANRATAVGWTSGIGRFGAVVGPWLGGQLVAGGAESWGFTAFALAALLATACLVGTRFASGGHRERIAPAEQPVAQVAGTGEVNG
jgi:MFS transporter, AAHS family, benzoate transport protein